MKKGLDMLIAVGKPKSKNINGASDSSISAPDQSGDAMAPGMSAGDPDEDDQGTEPGMQPDPDNDGDDDSTTMLPIPKGFKAPEDAMDGRLFTTTIKAKVIQTKTGNMLDVEAIGDMPIKGAQSTEGMDGQQDEDENPQASQSTTPSDESPDQSYSPSLSAPRPALVKRRKDEAAANAVFKGGR